MSAKKDPNSESKGKADEEEPESEVRADEKEGGETTFWLRRGGDDANAGLDNDSEGPYKQHMSSDEAKLVGLANDMGICVVWKFGQGPFNPCQGGDEDDVAYVPENARTPQFVYSPVFGCARIVVYEVTDQKDDLVGKLYIGMHS